mmetsp:Transcript_25195/g.39443  ORF Transcript_25195/g.39443 Transcript_25195/m.39443 type:complete len:379 (-) Transcript_25195:277-1413(-)
MRACLIIDMSCGIHWLVSSLTAFVLALHSHIHTAERLYHPSLELSQQYGQKMAVTNSANRSTASSYKQSLRARFARQSQPDALAKILLANRPATRKRGSDTRSLHLGARHALQKRTIKPASMLFAEATTLLKPQGKIIHGENQALENDGDIDLQGEDENKQAPLTLICNDIECFLVPADDCEGTECTIQEVDLPASIPKIGLNTGFKIWDAGRLLSKLLVSDYSHKLPTTRVLELGSGTGVGGLTAAAAGASVMLTDGSSDVLELLRVNVDANGFSRNVEVLELLWGDDHEDIVRDRGPYDLIIGSDLLYAPEVFDDLLDTLEQLCTPGVTEVLLTFPPRYTESMFFENAEGRNFELTKQITEVDPGLYTATMRLLGA